MRVRVKKYAQKETVMQLKTLTLAKYSKGTMIIKSGCKEENYNFFTKLKHKRNTSVRKKELGIVILGQQHWGKESYKIKQCIYYFWLVGYLLTKFHLCLCVAFTFISGGISAYNAGANNVRSYDRMDIGTTHHDYANDVVARAKFYKRNGY